MPFLASLFKAKYTLAQGTGNGLTPSLQICLLTAITRDRVQDELQKRITTALHVVILPHPKLTVIITKINCKTVYHSLEQIIWITVKTLEK